MIFGWQGMAIAVGIGIAAFGVQSTRLYFKQLSNDKLRQELSTCSARAANMELRRGIEDSTAAEPDPVSELRRSATRPN